MKIRYFAAIFVLAALIMAMVFFASQTPEAISQERTLTPTLNPDYRFVRSVDRDAIPAIDNPEFVPAAEADAEYRPDELVIGVEFNGDARAYSVPLLSRHEIVNDTVGRQPIVVTWCPLCFTSIVYDREVDGRILDFGVSGLLLNNAMVMYDRQTDSLWAHISGEALQGPLMDSQLEFLTSWFTTWEEWKTRHPDTLALFKDGVLVDNYASYYNSDEIGVSGVVGFEDRLPNKEFVVGIAHESEAIAYPFSTLRQEPVINDEVGDLPVVVIFLSESQTGLVYRRQVDEQMLEFSFDSETGKLVDAQTGSTWDAWRGIAVDGPLKGEILRRVHSTRAFWFGWRDNNPGSQIYGQ
jgi:hypothetical protein